MVYQCFSVACGKSEDSGTNASGFEQLWGTTRLLQRSLSKSRPYHHRPFQALSARRSSLQSSCYGGTIFKGKTLCRHPNYRSSCQARIELSRAPMTQMLLSVILRMEVDAVYLLLLMNYSTRQPQKRSLQDTYSLSNPLSENISTNPPPGPSHTIYC